MTDRVRSLGVEGIGVLEVLVALILFSVAALMGGRFIVQFVHQVGVSEARAQATEFAVAELERVRLLPYEDVAATEAVPVPEEPGYTRSVEVSAIGDDDPTALYNYRTITVTVNPPGALDPVSVSTAVSP